MKFLFSVLSLLFITASFSQKKSPTYLKAHFGPSNVKTESSKGNLSFAYGAGLEKYIPLAASKGTGIYINPSLTILKTGYETSGGGEVAVNYIVLSAPLILSINSVNYKNSAAGIYGGLGAFIGYAVSGKFRVLSTDNFKKMNFGKTTADNREQFDAGAVLKFGYSIKRLQMGAEWNIGLVNVIPSDRRTGSNYIKSRNFLFTVAYAISK